MFERWRSSLIPILVLLFYVSNLEAKDYKNSKCPQVTECPPRASPCKSNEECGFDEICCDSPCGSPICTQQLYTGCQQVQRAARRRAKSLGDDGKKVHVPRCGKSGAFEEIQCDNEINSSCWCVDDEGFELPGTRAPAASLVNCTAPKDCAVHTCRMLCPHGFALTKEGCPMCKCRDPCDDVKCPGGLSCHLDDLPCSDPPCPPVPSCKRGRSLENFCPIGDPLRIIESGLPFLCGTDPGKPTCPPMFQCLVKRGHDYGVCCPASLQIQKAGQCPAEGPAEKDYCGQQCQHDLECHSIQKCCDSNKCGRHCVHPQNLTECIHQRKLADLLAINERAGKGYVPQCTETGQFEPRQCSRNGLVCWCVDKSGHKIQGTMGAAANVSCEPSDVRTRNNGRSISTNTLNCEKLECAAVCEYGFKLDEDGCPTCKCDNPCEGYECPSNTECVVVKDSNCQDFLCPTVPVCRPNLVYHNPCEVGSPLTDDLTGSPIVCAIQQINEAKCPAMHECTKISGATHSVCCPVVQPTTTEKLDRIDSEFPNDEPRPQTMCEYLRDFSESMEGTREGMSLALPAPKCDSKEGSFMPRQCHKGECWCVDGFGTEIPRTRGKNDSAEDCEKLRETLGCLDLTCRMGCEYGFELDEKTRCPKCQCKDPCSGVICSQNEQCQLVEVSCKDFYCPPVPACLPRKTGQCPYLVPASSSFCDFECNSDLACNGSSKCCSNGCGTQCTEPLHMTACEHQRAVAQHQAHESSYPLGKVYIPKCRQDGTFEELQCDPAMNQCWCVDFRGFELSSTRQPMGPKATCKPPPKSNCPLYHCTEDCEHGFEIDDFGCRTCKCVNPCDRITCKEDGERCRLVKVECTNLPCPSVAMCLPEKENPCQHGEPLMVGGEQAVCGPEYDTCPTSHKCQLSPLGEYAVCCPKPRDVCFETKDEGFCTGRDFARNLTRYYFNSKTNKCETFQYTGCRGNHNNFHTEKICKQTCPVLSRCEILREKNQKAAEKYNKQTFNPRCEPENGAWKAVQCLDHVGVCWCVTPNGDPVKGTLTRGSEPECNFRQARRKKINTPAESDIVFEELIMQLGTIEEPLEQEGTEEDLVYWEPQNFKTRCQALGAQCDSQGRFNPKQCDGEICWCVDEAGNQLTQTNTFKDGEQLCLPTPIELVEVTIGFRGEYDSGNLEPVVSQIRQIVAQLKGSIIKNIINAEPTPDGLSLQFSLEGSNKVDVAYKLEEMVTNQNLLDLTPDITRSQFVHRAANGESSQRVIALQHREIIAQSPVSVVAPYHTALIVIACGSAFIISVLVVLVILYRKKVSNLAAADAIKDVDKDFMNYTRPIYIELPKEKVQDDTQNNIKT